MIDFVRGRIAHRELDYVVVDVNGVGYRVFVANPYTPQLNDSQEVTLFIHYSVREDAHLLFGFVTREEQWLFRRLLEVTGIGPRVAMGVLAGGRPEAVIAAIQQENLAFLTKLPGIGRKTAQRIVLDLKDKLSAVSVPYGEASASLEPTGASLQPGSSIVWREAREALVALGYTEAETDKAWIAVKPKVKDTDAIEIVMKLALQALFQGA